MFKVIKQVTYGEYKQFKNEKDQAVITDFILSKIALQSEEATNWDEQPLQTTFEAVDWGIKELLTPKKNSMRAK